MDNHPVLGILQEMKDLVESKASDYADTEDVYSNFTGSAKLANISPEVVFQVLIGVKVERLRQLTSGKEPNHESLDDTLIDLANYAALWLGFRREQETWVGDQLRLALDKATVSGYNMNPDDTYTGVPV